ncbi:MAG: DUF4105 domain-containing protein [Bacteriovoracaceae bacterium]
MGWHWFFNLPFESLASFESVWTHINQDSIEIILLGGKSEELLDAGINYSALETTKNPIMYALLGMFTALEARTFVSMPYYYKIREYNDHMNRVIFSLMNLILQKMNSLP